MKFHNVVKPPSDEPYPCPCCHHPTLGERGSYEICGICFWEDDGQDDPYADEIRGGPNGALSLTQARRNLETCGVSHPRLVKKARLP